MDVTNVLTPRTRALARELRNAKKRADETNGKELTLRELGTKVGKSHTTVSFWLSGKRIPSTEDVASFCTALGLNGPEKERLVTLARRASDTNWLATGVAGVNEYLAAVLEHETTADVITGVCCTDW